MMRKPNKRELELKAIFLPWIKINMEIPAYIDENAPEEAKNAFEEYRRIGEKLDLW